MTCSATVFFDDGKIDLGFDHDQFFGLDRTIVDESNAAVLHPRSRSADVLPHRKRRRLRGENGGDHDQLFGPDGTASSSTAVARPRSSSDVGLPQQKRYRLIVKQAVPGL